MKWFVKKEKKVWNVYLHQEFCKTTEPVLYCSSLTKAAALVALHRLNNPTDVQLREFKELESNVKNQNTKKQKKSAKKKR